MIKRVRLFSASLAVIFFALFQFGCATLKPGDIPEESSWEDFQPLTAEMQADVIQLRLDLLREKYAALDSSIITAHGSYKQAGELVPHHYLGTYAGAGLFVDINGNVAVDIIRLLGFDQAYSFKLHRTRQGALDAPADISRKGKAITVNEGGWGSEDIIAQIEDGGFSLQTSNFFSAEKIVFDAEKIDYIPSGLFSGLRTSSIFQDGKSTRGSTNYRVRQINENTLDLNGSYRITREGNKIILQGRGAPIATIVKSGNRYVFFRDESYGSWIEKYPDRIVISNNGSITEYSYEVEGAPSKPPRKAEPAAAEPDRTQRASRAKTGRQKIEKRTDRKTKREESSSLPPN